MRISTAWSRTSRRGMHGGLAGVTAVAALVIGVTASSGATPKTSIKGAHISVIGPEAGDTYYQEVACGATAEGKKLGMVVTAAQSAQNQSQAQEDSIFSNVLTTKPAGIIYTPVDPVAGAIPVKSANSANIPVIDVDAKLADASVYTSFIASNHFTGSEMITKLLAKQIGKSGQIIAIGSLPSNPITIARIGGMKAALKAYPKIKLVSVSYPALTPSAIQSDVASLLVKYPNLKAIYTTNYLNSNGAAAALRAAGKAGKIKMVSWDTDSSNIKLLQQHVLNETVAQQPYTMGEMAVQALADKLQGKPVPKSQSAPVSILTSAAVNTPAGKKLWYHGC